MPIGWKHQPECVRQSIDWAIRDREIVFSNVLSARKRYHKQLSDYFYAKFACDACMPLFLVMPISSAWHEFVRHDWSESHPHGSTSESGTFTEIHSEAAERQKHRIVDKNNLYGLAQDIAMFRMQVCER